MKKQLTVLLIALAISNTTLPITWPGYGFGWQNIADRASALWDARPKWENLSGRTKALLGLGILGTGAGLYLLSRNQQQPMPTTPVLDAWLNEQAMLKNKTMHTVNRIAMALTLRIIFLTRAAQYPNMADFIALEQEKASKALAKARHLYELLHSTSSLTTLEHNANTIANELLTWRQSTGLFDLRNIRLGEVSREIYNNALLANYNLASAYNILNITPEKNFKLEKEANETLIAQLSQRQLSPDEQIRMMAQEHLIDERMRNIEKLLYDTKKSTDYSDVFFANLETRVREYMQSGSLSSSSSSSSSSGHQSSHRIITEKEREKETINENLKEIIEMLAYRIAFTEGKHAWQETKQNALNALYEAKILFHALNQNNPATAGIPDNLISLATAQASRINEWRDQNFQIEDQLIPNNFGNLLDTQTFNRNMIPLEDRISWEIYENAARANLNLVSSFDVLRIRPRDDFYNQKTNLEKDYLLLLKKSTIPGIQEIILRAINILSSFDGWRNERIIYNSARPIETIQKHLKNLENRIRSLSQH